jgi:branched-chain amino acid aminotransferase
MATAYHDGKFVEKSSLSVNPNDFGFSRGITVFEMARIYGGKPLRLPDHLDRLEHGADMFGIKIPCTPQEMTNVVRRLCAENNYAQSAMRFYLTAGECAQPSGGGFAACDRFTPHLMILEDEIKPMHPEAPYGFDHYKKGQRLKTMPYERELPTVKSTNYSIGYHAARIKAGKEWDDILFTRRESVVTEATRSNFFCVIDDALCTAQSGMLFGVTRKIILELAVQLKIPVKECDLMVADFGRVTEAFTTGSIAELMPACQIDHHVLPMTNDGPIYKKLRQAFSACIAQLDAADASAS